ncbi:hypothetical protein IMW75_25680 [Pseudomonas gregormendelii]|uniref:Uncharacterized protein n=1 Tax=Pseudomonas gregormendelii TaxID=1628277 RepID=A0ABS3AN96_9PSED|nr:hypothetical protein [Pseudomonas gregormendelii]
MGQHRTGKVRCCTQFLPPPGFIEGADDLKKEEVANFIATRAPEDDPLLSEHLLELIEQAESEQKAKIIGVLFRRLVRSKISRDQFTDQVRFVNKIYIMDLFNFMHGYHNHYILEDGLGDILVNYRICKRTVSLASQQKNLLKQETEQYIKVSYEITGVGNKFLKSLHDAYTDMIDQKHMLED